MCLTCSTIFNRSFNLVRHYKEVHKIIHAEGKPVNFTCNQCLELFPSKKVMMEHRIKHVTFVTKVFQQQENGTCINTLSIWTMSFPAAVAIYLERKLY